MNICLCGAESGYQHDECCPYPLYHAATEREQLWRDAYEERKANLKRHGLQLTDDDERPNKWNS